MKNLTEWAVRLAGRVDSFLKQRTIVAVLMLYEGVMLLVESGNATRGMAMGIAIAIALAAGGIIAETLAQRGGKKKAIFPAILAIGLAVYIYFEPDFFAGILRYLIAASILMTGLLNLAQVFGISKIRRSGNKAVDEANASGTRSENSEMADTIRKTVETEIDKRIKPMRVLLSKLGKSAVSVWITGFLMTALGIYLLFRSVEGDRLMCLISGIIMIVTSLADLIAAYKMKQALKAGETDPSDEKNSPPAGTGEELKRESEKTSPC